MFKECQQSAHLLIGVIEESGEGLLQAHRHALFVVTQSVPGDHPGVARCQLGISRNDAQGLLPLEPLLTNDIPPRIKAAPILAHIGLGGLVRRVRGPKAQVQEKRFFRDGRLLAAQHANGLIDQVLGQVIALFGRARRIDRPIVAIQLGRKLVGFTLHEPVEAIKATRQGPLIKRTGCRGFFHGRQMPLAHGKGGVALRPNHFSQRGGTAADAAGAIGKTGVPVGQTPHAHRMVIAPGQKRRTGG